MLCQLPKYFSFYSCGNASADPVLPRKGDTTKHVDGAIIVALGLATAEGFSSVDKVVPEVTHEATPETTLNIEPQGEHEVDVPVPETEDTLHDIHASLNNDPTAVPLPLEPEASLIKTELVAEPQVETAPPATTNSFPIDVEVHHDPSLSETAPEVQKDNEAQTQVDGASNIKDEPISRSDIVEAADAEAPLEDVSASSTKQYQDTVQLEPKIDFVAPAEEEVESSPAAQGNVTDAAPITTEAITEVGETVDVLAQVNLVIP